MPLGRGHKQSTRATPGAGAALVTFTPSEAGPPQHQPSSGRTERGTERGMERGGWGQQNGSERPEETRTRCPARHCRPSSSGFAAAAPACLPLLSRASISSAVQGPRAGTGTSGPAGPAPSSLRGGLRAAPEQPDLRGVHPGLGGGEPSEGTGGGEGRAGAAASGPARRSLPSGGRAGPGPPGASHRLAARALGAPPPRLHIGAGRRPVREHGGPADSHRALRGFP